MPRSKAAPMVANPVRLDSTPMLAGMAPPTLGAHTSDILREVLGLSADDVGRLSDAGIVQR